MKLNLLFASLIALMVFTFPSCSESTTSEKKEAEKAEPKPDPNTLFSNFETVFFQEKLPFSLPHTTPPMGTSLPIELLDNFIKRKVEAYPLARFSLNNGFTAFITAENKDGNFNFILNVFDKAGKVTSHKMVAGKDAGTSIDAMFVEGGTWTETRTPVSEATGEANGEPIITSHTISKDGQIVTK
ncbi:MAG TPA: hypothetical protein ENJ82_06120 [Bacteroidetes bacterium]|nr:hypothetical protein [Bacteroidota bacterium]